MTLGAGYRLLVTDWLAVHLDVRDQMFDSDLLGKDKLTQNLQFSLRPHGLLLSDGDTTCALVPTHRRHRS